MKRTAFSLLLITCTTSLVFPPGLSGQTGKGAAPARRPTSIQQASDVWPRAYSLASEAQIVIFQPQATSWDNQKHLVAMAAVSYTKKDAEKPEMGTIKLESDTSVALQERLVKFTTPKVTETSFQTLSKEQVQEIVTEIEKLIPETERTISLDRVLAEIDKSTITPKNVEGLKADPPMVFFSQNPAILLSFDGDPIWSPIKDNELKFAVNTNWDVFEYPATKTYYLRDEASWLKATNLNGPWTPAGKLPDSFRKLPADDNWKDIVLNLPGKPITQAPHVYFSTKPSELIHLQGPPKYEPVPGTGLLWISNTESDLFRAGANGPFYYLVAGRWFTAPALNSSWNFATPNLPEDFKKISPEHPRSRVLASVPGTDQAAEAVLLAQVPQIARVNRKEIKPPEVIYQGEPQFELIQGTQLQRAVNTDKEIIKAGEAYYMCYQGVWFTSSGPAGEWQLATSIPAEIYQIPPSSPVYDVAYVTIEDQTPDTVTYAAAAGYTGLMIGWGCAVWGTGWYYPPYYWYGGYYPIYYPYWRTYGYGSWYNPYTGVYGTAGRIYGPYGGVGFGARYNPSTGTYARGAFAYGPYGARGAAQAYNPRTGTALQTRQGSGVYGSWGSTQVRRGDDWASTKRFTNSAGNTTRVTRGSGGGTLVNRRGEGFVGKKGDNVYAGRDGNAYRRDANGNWSKWENGQWNPAQRGEGSNSVRDSMMNDKARQRERTNPTQRDGPAGDRAGSSSRPGQLDSGTYRNLERDRASRAQGAQRMRDQQTFQNRTQSRPSNMGSYRGGGGFSRGGGGFRGGGGRRR
jgi:hypothetical protein